MTTFWITAVVLCALAMAFLMVPVLRHRRASGKWSPVGMAAAFAMVPLAFGLYVKVSNWDPRLAQHASEETRLVEQLAERLEKSPDDVQGWRLLARSYMALGKYGAARSAYAQAWQRTKDPDDDLKLSYAEAQVLADPQMLSGEPGKLIEQVLADQPDNAKALWYGGLVARELGHDDDLKARWTKLLQLNVPDEVASVVRSQLNALGVDVPTRPGAAAGSAGATAASGPSVKINVSLGPGRDVSQLGPNAALFIFARAPGGGPPVAVIRQPASAVPGEFTLSDANSMIPGRSLADFNELTLVARLSKSGQPTEQPGDWDAEAQYQPKEGGEVELVIDHVVGEAANAQSGSGSRASAAATAGASASETTGPTVKLNVKLGAGKAVDDLGPNAALFLFARAPGSRMPVAVIRRPASAVPGEFTLSDANSMIPGRSLRDFDEVTLVALLSRSGQAGEQPGDWYAQTQFKPKDGGEVALVIDKVVQ